MENSRYKGKGFQRENRNKGETCDRMLTRIVRGSDDIFGKLLVFEYILSVPGKIVGMGAMLRFRGNLGQQAAIQQMAYVLIKIARDEDMEVIRH